MNDLRIPAGVFPESTLETTLEKVLSDALGTPADFIHEAGNQQIWLNWGAMTDLDIKPEDVAAVVIDYLRAQPGVYDAFTREEFMMLPADYPFAPEHRRGIYPKRSGDIIFMLEPAWHPDDKAFGKGGTTHGSPYPYDTHVPLLWYGWKVAPGASFAPVDIIDIAPTLAAMLRITEPNGSQGKVIMELLKGR
jgi:arylsulfatase A-like enzyme